MMVMKPLSDLDRRLLGALRRDGRMPIVQLAEVLGVSRATVSSRMEALEAQGVIIGYTVRVRRASDAGHVRAISFIALQGQATGEAIEKLRGMPEIHTLHTTNGGWDLVAEISCANLAEFDSLLSRIRATPGVVNSETSLLLSTITR